MRVLLPTRRAARTLRRSFLQLNGGQPLLLPRLQPLGDVDAEELAFEAFRHRYPARHRAAETADGAGAPHSEARRRRGAGAGAGAGRRACAAARPRCDGGARSRQSCQPRRGICRALAEDTRLSGHHSRTLANVSGRSRRHRRRRAAQPPAARARRGVDGQSAARPGDRRGDYRIDSRRRRTCCALLRDCGGGRSFFPASIWCWTRKAGTRSKPAIRRPR